MCMVTFMAGNLTWAGEDAPSAAADPVAAIQDDAGPRFSDIVQYRAALDASARGVYNQPSDRFWQVYDFGIDAFGTISSPTRDWASFVVQLYATRLQGHPNPPGFFDGSYDWELLPKVNTLNFHLSGDGRFNLRAGHMELPYGLDAMINTSGTLRQMNNGRNLGTKIDWGATLNGTFPEFMYEFGVGRGSGMDYVATGDPHMFVGRVGTPVDTRDFYGTPAFGLSFYETKLRLSNGRFTDRWRVGVDGQHYVGPLGLLGEVSLGENDNVDVVNTLAEVNLANARQTVLGYFQSRINFREDAIDGYDNEGLMALGVRYAPDNHWALSAQFSQQLWNYSGPFNGNQTLEFQLRYRL